MVNMTGNKSIRSKIKKSITTVFRTFQKKERNVDTPPEITENKNTLKEAKDQSQNEAKNEEIGQLLQNFDKLEIAEDKESNDNELRAKIDNQNCDNGELHDNQGKDLNNLETKDNDNVSYSQASKIEDSNEDDEESKQETEVFKTNEDTDKDDSEDENFTCKSIKRQGSGSDSGYDDGNRYVDSLVKDIEELNIENSKKPKKIAFVGRSPMRPTLCDTSKVTAPYNKVNRNAMSGGQCVVRSPDYHSIDPETPEVLPREIFNKLNRIVTNETAEKLKTYINEDLHSNSPDGFDNHMYSQEKNAYEIQEFNIPAAIDFELFLKVPAISQTNVAHINEIRLDTSLSQEALSRSMLFNQLPVAPVLSISPVFPESILEEEELSQAIFSSSPTSSLVVNPPENMIYQQILSESNIGREYPHFMFNDQSPGPAISKSPETESLGDSYEQVLVDFNISQPQENDIPINAFDQYRMYQYSSPSQSRSPSGHSPQNVPNDSGSSLDYPSQSTYGFPTASCIGRLSPGQNVPNDSRSSLDYPSHSIYGYPTAPPIGCLSPGLLPDNELIQDIPKLDTSLESEVKMNMPAYKNKLKDLMKSFIEKMCCTKEVKKLGQYLNELKITDGEKHSFIVKACSLDLPTMERYITRAMKEIHSGQKVEIRLAIISCLGDKVLGQNPEEYLKEFGRHLLRASVVWCYQYPAVTYYVVNNIYKAYEALKLTSKNIINTERDQHGDNLLIFCARAGDSHADVLAALCSVQAHCPLFDLYHCNTEGYNALHVASILHSKESPRLHILHVLLVHAEMDILSTDRKGGDISLQLAVKSPTCDFDLILYHFQGLDKAEWHKLVNYKNPDRKQDSPKAIAKRRSSQPEYPKDVLRFFDKCHNKTKSS